MPTEDLARIERALGERVVSSEPARGHGAPSNRRWIVTTAAGRAFVKIAAFAYTAEWLRLEHRNYRELAGLSCMPRLLGWDDDGACPTLAIEDLSEARWPPPWDDAAIAAVREAIAEVAATAPPAGVRSARAGAMFDLDQGWPQIAEEPEGFLALGVCSPAWLDANLHALRAAADAAVVDGDTLVHGDVRSDNLCLRDGRVLLLDWNWACLGHEDLDLVAWLPSLAVEGGPEPWTMLPGRGPLASLLAGFFLEHARREPIPQAPHVRRLQRDQGIASLTWAAVELGLERP